MLFGKNIGRRSTKVRRLFVSSNRSTADFSAYNAKRLAKRDELRRKTAYTNGYAKTNGIR